MKKQKTGGFTLVELLVVLVILAILAAAVIPSMMGFIDRAEGADCLAYMRQLNISYHVVYNEDYGLSQNHSFSEILEDSLKLLDLPDATVTGSDTTMTLLWVCPENGTITATDLGDGNLSLNCSLHGALSSESSGDAASPSPSVSPSDPASGSGFTVPENTPAAVSGFFSSGWSTGADKKDVSFQYKTFTYNGTTYCIVLSTAGLDSSSVRAFLTESGVTYDSTTIAANGSFTNDTALAALSGSLGLENTIDDFSFTGTAITSISYK